MKTQNKWMKKVPQTIVNIVKINLKTEIKFYKSAHKSFFEDPFALSH